MKFDLEAIKRYVLNLVKGFIMEVVVKTAAKPLIFMAYNIPVVSIISYVKKILSFIGLSKSVEDEIHGFLNHFLTKAILGQQVAKMAWAM